MLYLDKGGVKDVGCGAGSLGSGWSPKAATAGRSGGPPSDGHTPARVRLPQQLLRRAPKLHHLHPQRLAHRGLRLALQVLQRSAHGRIALLGGLVWGAGYRRTTAGVSCILMMS